MIKEVYFLDFYNSLVDGKKENCSKVIDTLINDGTDLKDIYMNIYQKSLYRIGKLWEDNEVTIAEEHLATNIVEDLMNKHQPKHFSKNNTGKKALVTCIDKEYHKIGAKMAADIFNANGWQTFFLGASTPTREVVKFIKEKKPDVVGLSFNFYMNTLRFLEVIDHIKTIFPDQKIIAGGQSINGKKENLLEKYPDVIYFPSIIELDAHLKKNASE